MERRLESINSILLELGVLKEIAEESKRKIDALNEKVTIQNGRVRGLEAFKQFSLGCIAIIVLVIVPVILEVFKNWFVR